MNGELNWITNFIWGIADDVLRDLYVRGKYRDVILPMTVLRRLIDSGVSVSRATTSPSRSLPSQVVRSRLRYRPK
jgi:hypothetical protein